MADTVSGGLDVYSQVFLVLDNFIHSTDVDDIHVIIGVDGVHGLLEGGSLGFIGFSSEGDTVV